MLRRALAFAGGHSNSPSRVAFFEDSLKNLVAAKRVGMATVLIQGKTCAEEGGAAEGMASVDAVVAACTTDAVKARGHTRP